MIKGHLVTHDQKFTTGDCRRELSNFQCRSWFALTITLFKFSYWIPRFIFLFILVKLWDKPAYLRLDLYIIGKFLNCKINSSFLKEYQLQGLSDEIYTATLIAVRQCLKEIFCWYFCRKILVINLQTIKRRTRGLQVEFYFLSVFHASLVITVWINYKLHYKLSDAWNTDRK